MSNLRNRAFRPGAAGVRQALGHLEARIMEHLWKHGPRSVAEIHRALDEKSPLAYTTVFTDLSRLVDKGLVVKRGKHLETRYAPAATREAFVESLVAQVLGGLIDAHGEAAIHGFVKAIVDDEAALDELTKTLRNTRRSRKHK